MSHFVGAILAPVSPEVMMSLIIRQIRGLMICGRCSRVLYSFVGGITIALGLAVNAAPNALATPYESRRPPGYI